MTRSSPRPSLLPLLLVFLFFIGACDIKKPIKVGFSGQLTGPNAIMGVTGRDGVLLALDEINAAGGIAGRQVLLLARDDKGTAEGALAADQELIDGGVVAIIGHMTSSQSMAAIALVEKAGMVLLSPSTSTPALTGRVDHFFRVICESTEEARYLARHAFSSGAERIAALFDKDNSAYTETYLNAFRDELHRLGGRMVAEAAFSSAEKPVFGPLVARVRAAEPQGLLIIASAYDGALIAQQPRIQGWQARLFGCAWALSEPLIENGGRAVEGMHFVINYDLNSGTPEFSRFQKNYLERFKQMPTFMSGYAYEAMLVMAAALQKTGGRAEGLAQALPGISIVGLSEQVSLDQYGDGVRGNFQITVENGKFVTKGRLGR